MVTTYRPPHRRVVERIPATFKFLQDTLVLECGHTFPLVYRSRIPQEVVCQDCARQVAREAST